MQMSGNGRRRRVFNQVPLFVAMLGCLYGGAAMAQVQNQAEASDQAQVEAPVEDQAPAAQEQATEEGVAELEAVTVTGSLLRRQDYESISPVQIITADTNITLGQVETAEFLQQSSVASGSTQINNQFSGFVIEGGTGVKTVSLRGLGAQRTLVLLNGRRPGPAGTRGQVAAFDLNVIPEIALQRAEILKDGASSIYGTDAVAGVVNLITRKRVDRPEINVTTRMPFESGGEVFDISGITGWNFDNGSIMLAGEWYLHKPLRTGDRDFLECSEDLVWDQDGNRIDREDRSILAGTDLAGCPGNLYANTVIDAITGDRYIPSPDGVTIGLIPGYRPRQNGRYTGTDNAFFEDVLNFDFYGSTQVIDRQERFSLYGASDFTFGSVNWDTEWLFTRRDTDSHRYRQFFPLTGGATAVIPVYSYANDPDYVTPVPSGIAQPIMPFPSDSKVQVDYFYVTTGLDGLFSSTDTWAWQTYASYSRSEGEYSGLGIVASRSGDVQYDLDAPLVDYFDPGFLSGARIDDLVAAVGEWNTGNTVYDQFVVNGVVTGELFDLPAGGVGAAFGMEYRRFSLDDQPSDLSRNGDLWGQSSAQVTKGDDSVTEAFAELEVPIIADKPGFESLTFNTSVRAFEYDSASGSDSVWKVGLGWQIIPSLKLRATRGTSYRAPGLYELYLGDQTGFFGQLAIDPCITWGESNNEFVRANCAAAGIPDDYAGAASSATVISGGGAGVLEPETSEAFTAGIIFTPTFANFSVSLDYFEFEVNDQIAQLGPGAILGGCYGAPVYPNAFCDLFDRNPGDHPTAPFMITEVHDSYLNVNLQKTRGYDMLFNYDRDFAVGSLEIDGSLTYIFEDFEQLFDPELASGFETNERNGTISRPKLVGNLRTSFERNDWTYTWAMRYVDGTESLSFDREFDYQDFENAVRDIRADSRLYHTASVLYEQPNWSILLGIHNVFDAKPPRVSGSIGETSGGYGNIPLFASQYDWYGRSAFARFNYKF